MKYERMMNSSAAPKNHSVTYRPSALRVSKVIQMFTASGRKMKTST